MARDLIPPPSPAGKPTTPGGVPNLIELPPEPPRSAAQPSQQPPTYSPSAFRNRFGFLAGALAGVFVAAALIAAVAVWQQSGRQGADFGLEKNWSKWQPSDTTLPGGAKEIADKVGAEYLGDNGKQLVQVRPVVNSMDIVLRPAAGSNKAMQGVGVLYQLDGLGEKGSILGGEPSLKRLQMLHREALELSLYTFRYLPEAEMVMVMLPPPANAVAAAGAAAGATATAAPTATATPTATPAAGIAAGAGTAPSAANPCAPNANGMTLCQSALFFRPGDLKQYLEVPLGVTVPANPPTPDQLDPTEGAAIDQLTKSNKFLWLGGQDPATGAISMVLDR